MPPLLGPQACVLHNFPILNVCQQSTKLHPPYLPGCRSSAAVWTWHFRLFCGRWLEHCAQKPRLLFCQRGDHADFRAYLGSLKRSSRCRISVSTSTRVPQRWFLQAEFENSDNGRTLRHPELLNSTVYLTFGLRRPPYSSSQNDLHLDLPVESLSAESSRVIRRLPINSNQANVKPTIGIKGAHHHHLAFSLFLSFYAHRKCHIWISMI